MSSDRTGNSIWDKKKTLISRKKGNRLTINEAIGNAAIDNAAIDNAVNINESILAELVPFIPNTLEVLKLHKLKAAFEHIISLFPSFTVFSNKDETYYDMINFLQNVRFKVTDERLNAISTEDRKTLVHAIQYIKQNR